MNLVVHQVCQLHHVDIAHRQRVVEGLARQPVAHHTLTRSLVDAASTPRVLADTLDDMLHHVRWRRVLERLRKARLVDIAVALLKLQHLGLCHQKWRDDRRCVHLRGNRLQLVHRHLAQFGSNLSEHLFGSLVVAELHAQLQVVVHVVLQHDASHVLRHTLQLRQDVLLARAGERRLLICSAEVVPCPPEVSLLNLPDVHARRHPQRVQHDVHGRAIGQEGHVLIRQYLGDDAFVSVASCHLVAFHQLALLRHIHSHEHVHTRRQVIRRDALQLATAALALGLLLRPLAEVVHVSALLALEAEA